jgi:hypothetical protein
MVNTSRWPITVDGVRLDNHAYNISTRTGRDLGPETIGENVATEGRHGELWTAHKKFGPSRMVLRMWVGGTDEDGVAPTDDYSKYRANLDLLLRLFSTRHRLLDVRQTVSEAGPVVRQALAEVTTVIDPGLLVPSPYTSELTVEFKVPGAFWTDVAETTYDSAAGIALPFTDDLDEFDANTAPMVNMYTVVDGPITNPKLIDNRNGHWVMLNEAVPTGSQWVVNTELWTSKTGVGIAFTQNGNDKYSITTFAGGHSPKLFGIVADHAGPQVRLEGTGAGAGTRLRIRGKRTYL